MALVGPVAVVRNACTYGDDDGYGMLCLILLFLKKKKRTHFSQRLEKANRETSIKYHLVQPLPTL